MRWSRPRQGDWKLLGKGLTEALPGGDRGHVELIDVEVAERHLPALGAADDDARPHPLHCEPRPGKDAVTCEFAEQLDIALEPLADALEADLAALAVLDRAAQLLDRGGLVFTLVRGLGLLDPEGREAGDISAPGLSLRIPLPAAP